METIENELPGLEISITKIDDTTMSNQEKAYIIYLKIKNKINSNRELELSKATYVTSIGEQIEQNIWLSDYLIEKDILRPNAYKEAGLVFYKSRLTTIKRNDLLYITFKLPSEGKEVVVTFENNEKLLKQSKWIIKKIDIDEFEIQLSVEQQEKYLLKRIEKLDAFEERFGVRIERPSIRITNASQWFEILGELHSLKGMEIKEHIYVHCIIYDIDGSILVKEYTSFSPDTFFGFSVFKIRIQEDNLINQIGVIRLYPQNTSY